MDTPAALLDDTDGDYGGSGPCMCTRKDALLMLLQLNFWHLSQGTTKIAAFLSLSYYLQMKTHIQINPKLVMKQVL